MPTDVQLLDDLKFLFIAHQRPAADLETGAKTPSTIEILHIHAANPGARRGQIRKRSDFWIFAPHVNLSYYYFPPH